MIKVTEEQNTYKFNNEEAENILSKISGLYVDYCTQEEATEIKNMLDQFLADITINKELVEVEKHETEEQAREYFGEDFIKEFNQILQRLDKEDTILYLHGTSPGSCPSIMDEGLRCGLPQITSTSCGQTMPAGDESFEFQQFESLLNWGHKNYKGLVMLAIPYETFYKEGLFTQLSVDNGYSYKYLINPDFIVGYIDVNTKQIIMNPKYSREHNYEGLMPDMNIYHPNPSMTNELIRESLRNTITQEDEEIELPKLRNEVVLNPSSVLLSLEDLIGIFRRIQLLDNQTIKQEQFDYFADRIKSVSSDLGNIIHLLKTKQELGAENKKYDEIFGDVPSIQSDTTFDDESIEWDDSSDDEFIEWNESSDVDKFFENLESEEPIQKR